MSSKTLSIPTNLPFPSPKPPSLPQLHHHLLSFPKRHYLYSLHIPKCQPNSNSLNSSSEKQHQQVLEQAQEAIFEYIQGLGVSVEDSKIISLGSNKYAMMLVDGVRDLEEWSSWNGNEFRSLGFKEKIVHLAKEKGDGGKVAFLESVGLSLSSAMNVARYLSNESLPGLIHKVKYMKQVFFSDIDDKRLVGKNARRMMMHLSIPIDEDLQQTLSFFEKIEARRGGLDLLGSSDSCICYLVEAFPRVLLLPVDSHLKLVVELLESIGVPKERMGEIFLLFPPILLSNVKDIKRKFYSIMKIGVQDKDIGKMLLKYPWILSEGILSNYVEILSLFEMEKVEETSVQKAIRSWPHLLGCSRSKLTAMVEHLCDIGVRNKKLGQVIASSPQLLLRKPHEFLEVVAFLKEIGFDDETVGKILGRCPEVFALSVEKTLKRKVEFLASVGMSKNHLPRAIKKYPELLISDTDRTLLPRLRYLMKFGLSKKEVAFMVSRFSPLLGYSIDEVLRPKYEFLVKIMQKPVTELIDYPRYFSYSLEKKIKPRFYILKEMNIKCSLKEMLDKNDEEFAEKFMDAGKPFVSGSSIR